MDIFELIGPVMVGPSSSHTAGAARIGAVARRLLAAEPERAELCLMGSFAATGPGHGTDRALVAGLLGMEPDDLRIPSSFELARERGLDFRFTTREAVGLHPNTVELRLSGGGRELSLRAQSIGGGRIQVTEINGLELCFSAEKPSIIISNEDRPGTVALVSGLLGSLRINIATFHVNRDSRGGRAIMVIECDSPIPPQVQDQLQALPGVLRAIVI